MPDNHVIQWKIPYCANYPPQIVINRQKWHYLIDFNQESGKKLSSKAGNWISEDSTTSTKITSLADDEQAAHLDDF
uniref:Uncharacterized protein n=1 Tax=Caenorhabditis japonica TaxID=281687 RepID=A0A8R1IHE3_CAEJA